MHPWATGTSPCDIPYPWTLRHPLTFAKLGAIVLGGQVAKSDSASRRDAQLYPTDFLRCIGSRWRTRKRQPGEGSIADCFTQSLSGSTTSMLRKSAYPQAKARTACNPASTACPLVERKHVRHQESLRDRDRGRGDWSAERWFLLISALDMASISGSHVAATTESFTPRLHNA